MVANYEAWNINLDEFHTLKSEKERVKFLLKFAVLAPSSHNTQPWRFEYSENEIVISSDFSRSLPESDKNNRQLYTSLGCALENILVAAGYFNYLAEYQIVQAGYKANIIISLLSGGTNRGQNLINAISKRVTNRHLYDMTVPIPAEIKELVDSQNRKEFCVDLISDGLRRNTIADIAIRAGIGAMEDSNFRRELSHYVKNNLTKSYCGMPCFGMNIPTPPSFFGPTMIRFINMNKVTRKQDTETLVKNTPAFIIISTVGDTIKDWIETGIAFQTLALTATQAGLQIAPMAGAIQIGEYYKELRSVLQTKNRPQFLARIGFAKLDTPHSPRLSVDMVTK